MTDVVDRLMAAYLFTAIVEVGLLRKADTETALVSVAMDSSDEFRQFIHRALDGLPYECVYVERPPRAVTHGHAGFKDGRTWRIGTQDEVAWIKDHTSRGVSIECAIPPAFDQYATVVIPESDEDRIAGDSALLRLLIAHSAGHRWWLGYLDTGAHDVIFDDAPRVTLYAEWPCVLVEAGPMQAGIWREDAPWVGRLPDLIYPADRSWLVSKLWDDDWRCLGGSAALLRAIYDEPRLESRSVSLDQDATPRGHVAR